MRRFRLTMNPVRRWDNAAMIIESHAHVWSFPVLEDLADKIQSTEDLVAFRTRYPELYKRTLTEPPIDNSDALIELMDRHGIDKAIVQARPGKITNEQVAASVRRHPGRLYGLLRLGQDQTAAYEFAKDPTSVRTAAVAQITHCIERLGMKGMGEIRVRSLTRQLDPELIAEDLKHIMDALEQFGAPVQIPTAWSQFPGGLIYGNPIWVDEVAGRHPGVPIILTKMGRGIQYYFDTSMAVAMRNTNVYFDIVGTTAEHLRKALDALGSKRILFGTDWSATKRWITKPADVYTSRFRVLDGARLSAEEREDILWRNAARIFRLGI